MTINKNTFEKLCYVQKQCLYSRQYSGGDRVYFIPQKVKESGTGPLNDSYFTETCKNVMHKQSKLLQRIFLFAVLAQNLLKIS